MPEYPSLLLPPRVLCLGNYAFHREYIFKHFQGPEHLLHGMLAFLPAGAWFCVGKTERVEDVL